MQSVFWTDDDIPPIMVNKYGDAQFFDRPQWYGFEVGDQIVHLSEIGPSVYRVVDVQIEYDDEDYYPPCELSDGRRRTDVYANEELYRVTIQGA